MVDRTIPLEDISRIDFLKVRGNLHLSGWNRDQIQVKDLNEEIQVDQKPAALEISSLDDVLIRIPHNLDITIQSVSGDAIIKGLRSKLEIKSISGDLVASDISALSAESIAGDLIASRIQGNLQLKSVGGDCLIDNIQGQVELKAGGGDVQIDTVSGGVDFKAGGDGTVEFHPVPWQAYQLKVGGDLSLTMPVDTNADLSIKSGARDITIFPGKLDIKHNEKELSHTLGEGGPTVLLTAGGKVFIIDDEFTTFTGLKLNLDDLGSIASGFSADTSEYIRDNLAHLEEDLTESFSGLSESLKGIGLSEEKLKDLGAKFEQASRETAEKAEIAAIKAQAKVEKKIAKARRKALKAQEKIKHFDLDQFLESKSEKKSISDNERLMILEMLQEKKISPEEAEELLAALEGNKT